MARKLSIRTAEYAGGLALTGKVAGYADSATILFPFGVAPRFLYKGKRKATRNVR